MTAEQSIRNIERTMDAVNAELRATPKPDPRADLVDLFERYAERGNDDQLYIDVETAADLVVDNDWQQASAGDVEWAWRNDCGEIRTATSVHAARLLAAKYNGTAMSRTIGPWAEADS